jgi:hypothetical protein
VLEFGSCGHVRNKYSFEMFEHLQIGVILFISLVTLFHFLFAWMNSSRGGSFSRVARWSGGEREGSYPRGGVGYLWLARPSRLAALTPPESARGLGLVVLSALANFCEKMGPFFWWGGMPPAVAPECGLVFWGKAKFPFNFIDLLISTSRLPTGVLGM